MPDSKDEAIQVESRVVPSEETLRRAFLSRLQSSMVTHYGTYAGITAIRLIVHFFYQNRPGGVKKAAEKVAAGWVEEAKRAVYPEFCKERIQILEAQPDIFKGMDLDKVFEEALQDTAELIRKSVQEVDKDLFTLSKEFPPEAD